MLRDWVLDVYGETTRVKISRMYNVDSVFSERLCHLVRHLPSKEAQGLYDHASVQQLHVTKRVNINASPRRLHYLRPKRQLPL
jgi:hypothetical protein